MARFQGLADSIQLLAERVERFITGLPEYGPLTPNKHSVLASLLQSIGTLLDEQVSYQLEKYLRNHPAANGMSVPDAIDVVVKRCKTTRKVGARAVSKPTKRHFEIFEVQLIALKIALQQLSDFINKIK